MAWKSWKLNLKLNVSTELETKFKKIHKYSLSYLCFSFLFYQMVAETISTGILAAYVDTLKLNVKF